MNGKILHSPIISRLCTTSTAKKKILDIKTRLEVGIKRDTCREIHVAFLIQPWIETAKEGAR